MEIDPQRTLYSTLTHLEEKNSSVRMLFVDLSSTFNTVIPSKLVTKLSNLGFSPELFNLILDFLSDRRQVVRMGSSTSAPLTLNTGAPRGCVLSPLLSSLYTHNCVPTHQSNLVVKFADDTTVVGLITIGEETAFRRNVDNLVWWSQENVLSLNVTVTKEMVVDYRKGGVELAPITIKGAAVERVSHFKFLGINNNRGPHAGHTHRRHCEKVTTMPLLIEEIVTSWHGPSMPSRHN